MDNRRSSEPDILKTCQLLANKTIILVEIVLDNLGRIIVSKNRMNLLTNICQLIS